MRPMFIDLHEVLGSAPPPPGARGQDTAMLVMQRLNALYKDLLHAVKEEALLMEQIFPDPGSALAAFISRVFEQKIKARNLSGKWSLVSCGDEVGGETCVRGWCRELCGTYGQSSAIMAQCGRLLPCTQCRHWAAACRGHIRPATATMETRLNVVLDVFARLAVGG